MAKIANARTELAQALEEAEGDGSCWQHVRNQIGMFAFTGLTSDEVDTLRKEENVYMTFDGRLSLAGLSLADIPYVAQSIARVRRSGHGGVVV